MYLQDDKSVKVGVDERDDKEYKGVQRVGVKRVG